MKAHSSLVESTFPVPSPKFVFSLFPAAFAFSPTQLPLGACLETHQIQVQHFQTESHLLFEIDGGLHKRPCLGCTQKQLEPFPHARRSQSCSVPNESGKSASTWWPQGTSTLHPTRAGCVGSLGNIRTRPKEREDQGSAAALAPTPGFRDPVFDLAMLPGLGTLCQDPQLSHQSLQLRVSQQAEAPDAVWGALSRGSPRGAAQRHPSGVDPRLLSPPWRLGGKLSWGRKEPAGPGSDTSQIREVCGLEPKHRM